MTRRTDQAERRIPATPAAVFAAMIDLDAVVRWLPPQGMTATVHAFDPRPGGDYRMTLFYSEADHPRGKAGADHDEIVGRFGNVERDRLIEQIVEFPSYDPELSGTMTMRWIIEPDGDGALVRVEAIDVPPAIDADVHRAALASTLASLEREVAP